MNCRCCQFSPTWRGVGPRPLADPESVFLGLRQSCRRISVRHVFALCECGRRFDLEISARFSTTGGCTFDRASFCARDWRIFACTRSRVFSLLIDLCRADRLFKRLDHLLGSDRLVWCTRRVHLAAMGVVGSGTRSRFAANEMAISLAGAIRLSARHGWISLHGFNAVAPHCMVVDQVRGPRRRNIFSIPADARRRGTRFWSFRPRMAGAS